MGTYKLLAWNLHMMTNEIPVKNFVLDRLLNNDDAVDIIVLVEYKRDSTFEEKLKSDNYAVFCNNAIKGTNEILIAIKKDIIKIDTETNSNDELIIKSGQCMPNFLHVSFKDVNGRAVSVVGVRFLSPTPSGGAITESEPLNRYLDTINGSWICCGDFNILDTKIKEYFPDYDCSIVEGKGFKNSSFIFTDFRTKKIKQFGKLDHFIYKNIEKINSVSYSWDFLCKDTAYPDVEDVVIGNRWDIPAGIPDHAILKVDILL